MSFCDSEVGDGSGCINAICSRPEADDDVFSCQNLKAVEAYVDGKF